MYKVRKAVVEDLPILLEFEQGIVAAERPFDTTLKEGRIHYYDIKELIENDMSEVYVVTFNEEIKASGYAKIKKAEDFLSHTSYAYLGFMFVDEEHRGKGLNKKIVEALLGWSKSKNIEEIRLNVYDKNEVAIKAYEKAGFEKHTTIMRRSIKEI